MGSWGKRLIIIPDNIRADEISWAFKKGTLHHPACAEVVRVMATGYYGDQNNKWAQKLVGQFGRGWDHQFLLKIVSRMKPQKFLCHQKLWGWSLSACPASCVLPLSLFLTTLGTWSQVRLCSLVRQPCSSVMLLKFMTDIFIFIFSTSSITVSSGRPRCIIVFVPHSSSQWQRSSPFPTHKGIVDSGRVCWLFMGQQSLCEWVWKGPEGLTASFLLLTLCVVPHRKGHADPAMPALPPPALGCIHFLWVRHREREEN